MACTNYEILRYARVDVKNPFSSILGSDITWSLLVYTLSLYVIPS